MDTNQRLWSRAKDELIRAVEGLGFPAELGVLIAKHLGSPRAMGRMVSYLEYVKPRSEELIIDEMLAIRSEIDAWKGARGPVDLGFARTGAETRRPAKRQMPVIMKYCITGSRRIQTNESIRQKAQEIDNSSDADSDHRNPIFECIGNAPL